MLDDADRYDPAAVQLWVTRDWERNLPRGTTKEQQEALRGHLAALLEKRPNPLPLALDGRLIQDAREVLNDAPRSPPASMPGSSGRDSASGIPDFTIGRRGR